MPLFSFFLNKKLKLKTKTFSLWKQRMVRKMDFILIVGFVAVFNLQNAQTASLKW